MKLKDFRKRLETSKEYSESQKALNLQFALADAVLEARMVRGWTQAELAKAIGTKQANISRIESGLANPTLEFISRLSNVLGFEVAFSCEKEEAIQFMVKPQTVPIRVIYSSPDMESGNIFVNNLPQEKTKSFQIIYSSYTYSKTHEDKVVTC